MNTKGSCDLDTRTELVRNWGKRGVAVARLLLRVEAQPPVTLQMRIRPVNLQVGFELLTVK
jgi:hypothetical protein